MGAEFPCARTPLAMVHRSLTASEGGACCWQRIPLSSGIFKYILSSQKRNYSSERKKIKRKLYFKKRLKGLKEEFEPRVSQTLSLSGAQSVCKKLQHPNSHSLPSGEF